MQAAGVQRMHITPQSESGSPVRAWDFAKEVLPAVRQRTSALGPAPVPKVLRSNSHLLLSILCL